MFLKAVEGRLRVKAPADHERRAEADPNEGLRESERVEHRYAQLGDLSRPERHLAQKAADQTKGFGLAARRALGGSGGAAREDRDLCRRAGARRSAGVTALDQCV